MDHPSQNSESGSVVEIDKVREELFHLRNVI